MNARFRFSANACLLSAMSGLILAPADSLIAQSRGARSDSRIIQTAGSDASDDQTQPIDSGNVPYLIRPGATERQQGAPRGAASSPRPAAAAPARPSAVEPAFDAGRKISGSSQRSQSEVKPRPTVQQTAGAVPGAYPQAAGQNGQSAVQRELEQLYRRDGRDMPPMTMSELPLPEGAIPVTQPGAPGARGNTAPGPKVVPAKPNVFKRMLIGMGLKKPTRPAPVPPQYYQPGAVAPQAPRTPYVVSSQAPQNKVAPPRTAPADSSRPRLFPGMDAPPIAGSGLPQLPAAGQSLQAKSKPIQQNDELGLSGDDDDEPMDDLQSEDEKPAELKSDSIASEQESSPYTGLKLIPDEGESLASSKSGTDDDEEMDLDDDEDELDDQPKNRFAAESTSPEAEQKRQLKLLAAHSELKGLKGFCAVTLKNQRQLAQARPEFKSEYQSKTYTFATAEAKLEFDSNPEKFAPVNKGTDIVCLADKKGEVEGSLQHAAWYKGRLYLFSSLETRDRFVMAPSQFVPKQTAVK